MLCEAVEEIGALRLDLYRTVLDGEKGVGDLLAGERMCKDPWDE